MLMKYTTRQYVINGKELGVFKLFFRLQRCRMGYYTQHAIIDFSVPYEIHNTAQAIGEEGTPLYIPPLTYIVNKKIIKNPNEFSG